MPEECLYVGDRQLEDVKGAGSVGMGTVWVNRNGEPLDPDLPSPDYQVGSLLELAEPFGFINIGTGPNALNANFLKRTTKSLTLAMQAPG